MQTETMRQAALAALGLSADAMRGMAFRELDARRQGVYKNFGVSVRPKAIDEEARTIEHVISTGSPDREGDVVEIGGWHLESYRKNPVVLRAHDHGMPIAKNIWIKAEGNTLLAKTSYPPAGVSALADEDYDFHRLGIVNSWSVGFIPLEFVFMEEGSSMRFIEQELLEYSSVAVPCNVEAMDLAFRKGILSEARAEALGWKKLMDAPRGDFPRLARQMRLEFTAAQFELSRRRLLRQLRPSGAAARTASGTSTKTSNLSTQGEKR